MPRRRHPADGQSPRVAVWVSTSRLTRGGIASFVRTMESTPLFQRWRVREVATHRNGSPAVRVLAFAVGLIAFLKSIMTDRPVVVHVHMASYGSFARKSVIVWLASWLGPRIVLQVHGGAFRDYYQSRRPPTRAYIRATLGRADVVIALGEQWAERLRSIAPSARVVVVPNSVRLGTQVAQPAEGEPVQVLFLGDVADHKGAFLLLDAWHRLTSDPSVPGDARLVLAGDGDLDRARRRVEELGLDEVDLRGWVNPERVEDLLAHSHVLVLPSRGEGQPMAVLEAMARSLCVVATDVGGIPDLVDETCGVLVPVDDVAALAAALAGVVRDASVRRELGAAERVGVRERVDVDVTWRWLDCELVR